MCKPLVLFTLVCCLFIATGNGSPTRTVGNDNPDFGTTVYDAMRSRHMGNIAISPFGLGTLLTIISHQIQTWRYKRTVDAVCPFVLLFEESLGTNESISEIMKNDFQDAKLHHAIKFYVANDSRFASIGPKDNLPFPVTYTDVDFHSDAESRINNDIRDSSGGLIQNSLRPGIISPNMTFIFMNLWTFEGNFKKGFQESILSFDFYINGQSIGRIRFLHLLDKLKTVHSDEMHSTIVEIPYKEKGFSMIAILPDSDAPINEKTTRISLPKLWQLLDGTEERDVIVQLPKFRIASSFSLKDTLIKAHVPEKPQCFSRTIDPYNGYVIQSDVRQSIFFAVEPTERINSQPLEHDGNWDFTVKFDRPFLIVLRYKELPLIMAEIIDPHEVQLFH